MEQKTIKLTEKHKSFIKELLEGTQEQFKETVVSFANSEDKRDKELFSDLYSRLAEIVYKDVPMEEYWALRSGDLEPEKVSDLGFSSRFCDELMERGLLFRSRAEAKLASIRALPAASKLLRKDCE